MSVGNLTKVKEVEIIALASIRTLGYKLEETQSQSFTISSGVLDVIGLDGVTKIVTGKVGNVIVGGRGIEFPLLAIDTTPVGEYIADAKVVLSTGEEHFFTQKIIIRDPEGRATVP